ncbi:hypothetical protein LB467_03995 [Salegentibacter sp. JZCK2]|uniref:hypothetical protein n=1 Tax=Salegentibacter tibetensis TaxID=2873600 RepID=UPI001CCD4DEF|nr:hypothetical protein [Salegentibacter tibetensis]MBZ9728839.1 hypothetical protein [Salegentibacter tibetensis]
MAQDIREMFRNEKEPKPHTLPKGHQKRFEDRLGKDFPKEKEGNSFFFLKIAAILIVALGVGFFFLNSGGEDFNNEPSVADTPTETSKGKENKLKPTEDNFQLSEVSPEFKKIEDYYMASLNIELSKINITPENKALIDSFMNQMSELDKEYQRLNTEIKEAGPNEQTLEAMIANLQLRLDLLYKLKNKLKEIKHSNDKEYENYEV